MQATYVIMDLLTTANTLRDMDKNTLYSSAGRNAGTKFVTEW
jgi:hypothetical protein